MALHEIRIPKLGMSTLECDIKRWLVQVGDAVAPGTPLLEVETEKAEVVIEADVGGRIREIRACAGDKVPVGAVVGFIEGP